MIVLPVGRRVAVVAVLRGLAVSAGGSLAPCRGGSWGALRVPVKRNKSTVGKQLFEPWPEFEKAELHN